MRICLSCNEPLEGRVDKIYCSSYCKSSYQYQKNKSKDPTTFVKIDHQLKLNRKILKYFNKAGKSVIRVTTLIEHGFDPNFFTHYWKNKEGKVYLFVYDHGFLEVDQKGVTKYVLVERQEYMCK